MNDCIAAKARVLAAPADGRVAVALTGQEACPGCRCGRLALAGDRRQAQVVLDVSTPLRANDEILVTIPAASVLRGALWLHGLPLLGLLAGAATAAALGSGDLGCLTGALSGLGVALLVLWRSQRRRYSDTAGGVRVLPTA